MMCSRVSQLSDKNHESARVVLAAQGWQHVRMQSKVELRGG